MEHAPPKVDRILTSMDPNDVRVLGAFINAIKIRKYKDRQLTETTVGTGQSPDQSTTVLETLVI
jgi:hypothetical protein